ncbi:MAG: resA 6 [Mucilaginibacter sp.]|nr:resA 6 [Mucilaginibacter sp.]
MKNLKVLLAIPCLLAGQSLFAQIESHVKLSNNYPSANEKVTVTYDPAGTVVEGKKDIGAVVYYLDNKDYPAADIDLKADGKLLKGDFTVPATAKAFFIKISAGNQVDNNDEKGYVYLVYKDKKPIEGAYASEGFMLSSGMGTMLAKIKTDNINGIALYKKEFALYPQSERDYQSNYYMLIARDPQYKVAVNEKIESLEKSADEKDLMMAVFLLKMSKNSKAADSLNANIKTRFPDGIAVKNDLGMSFFREKDLAKKDSLYNVYIKRYPENNIDKNTIQDNFRSQLASAYLSKGDMNNYHKYESQIKDKSALAMNLNNMAYEWAKKGEHLGDAEQFSKESLDIVKDRMGKPAPATYRSVSQVKKINQETFDMYADTYAYILYKEGKFDEALKYEQPVIDRSEDIDGDVYANYIQILGAVGQYAKAAEAAEKVIKAGKGTTLTREELKKDYVKLKGSEKGYDRYIASLEGFSKEKTRTELAKTMINKPAPVFALKDLDGKLVSLKDLKGKVVIVDFWATWCGPCKASFPGMQMAVNKYKDDPNVKFLFVDTWENGDNYTPGVRQFIADNKYSFHVLMDEKGEDGKQSKVVNTFGVTGIPTKFVIDKNGNIRFMYVGYSGTPEKLVDEVTAMIDMAGNPDGVISSQVK